MEGYRTCTKCGRTLPETEEYFTKSVKRGKVCFESRCKECRIIYYREYYAKNREKYLENSRKWFQEHKEYKEAYVKEWHGKHEGYWKKYGASRTEYLREYNRTYYLTHKEEDRVRCQKRRTLKKAADASLTTEEWEMAKLEFGNGCAYCGKQMKLEQDHFVPLSDGGGYTKENIIPSCKRCNCSKHANAFSDWYPSQPFYRKEREEHIVKYIERMKAK